MQTFNVLNLVIATFPLVALGCVFQGFGPFYGLYPEIPQPNIYRNLVGWVFIALVLVGVVVFRGINS